MSSVVNIVDMEKLTKSDTKAIWRESASLILAAPAGKAPKQSSSSDYDYKLLLLKRSDRTAMADNQVVFPGGLVDSADETVEWLKYFEEFGVSQKALKQLIVVNEQRPRIFLPQGTGCYDRFFKKSSIWAREISLRLTAIRETFEEVGILLCRSRDQLNDSTKCVLYREDFDRNHWQHVVHNEPKAFLQLCRQLAVVPDLWSIYEWSVWASPAAVKKGYETAFFIAFLQDTPNLLLERSEVKDCMWEGPADFLRLHRQGELWFLPPQMYELARFMGVKSLKVLKSHCQSENQVQQGSVLKLPVTYLCVDGLVSVLFGDDFYLPDPRSVDKFIPIDATVAEFRERAKHLHRCEYVGAPKISVRLNFELPNGQLPPVTLLGEMSKL